MFTPTMVIWYPISDWLFVC